MHAKPHPFAMYGRPINVYNNGREMHLYERIPMVKMWRSSKYADHHFHKFFCCCSYSVSTHISQYPGSVEKHNFAY